MRSNAHRTESRIIAGPGPLQRPPSGRPRARMGKQPANRPKRMGSPPGRAAIFRLPWSEAGLSPRYIHEPIVQPPPRSARSEEHTSELQSLMRISYAVFCLKKKKSLTYKTQTK